MRTVEQPRITICSAGELFGGVERHILGLTGYLVECRGVTPRVVLFHDCELAAGLRDMGIEPVILRGWHRYDPRLARQLADLIAAEGHDLVHCHGYKSIITCALARRRVPFAVVKTEHGRVEPTGGDPVVWVKTRLNHGLDTWATRHTGSPVCYVTDDLREFCAPRHQGLERITVHNGIAPISASDFSRPEELLQDRVNLGFIGRVSAVKGLPFLLQAMTGREIPPSVIVHIIGTGPLLEPLRAEVQQRGLAGRVFFHGFRDDVYRFIAHLDALVMPSLHEGLPYTLLEAMSLETPMLASRVGGLAEVVRDGKTGLLFETGDVAAIRNAILRLAQEPGLAGELGRAARRDLLENYTLQRMGDVYWRTYERTLKRE